MKTPVEFMLAADHPAVRVGLWNCLPYLRAADALCKVFTDDASAALFHLLCNFQGRLPCGEAE